MGLTMKSFQDILKGMVDWTAQNSSKLIDFSVGSVIRTLYEAVATEIEELYFRMYQNFQWAIENSIYESFGFSKLPATEAYGDLKLTFTGELPVALEIPEGTRFMASLPNNTTLYYETRQDYIIPMGSSEAVIRVYCTVPGTIGNVAANTITRMVNPIQYVSTVTNEQRFITGKDEETDSARRARFANYVQTRSRGTKKALEYGVLEIPQVSGVYVDDSQIGIVRIYAHDAAGDLPDDVKNQIIQNIENYRPAGIPVIVLPTVKILQDVEVNLELDTLYNNGNFIQYIKDSIENYLNSFSTSEDLLLSDLNAFIRSIDTIGIKNCTIITPSKDVIVENYQVIRSGTVTVNVM